MKKLTANNKTISDIFQAAELIFLENNAEPMTIRSIAKLSGYSYGTIYKYFKNIDDFKCAFFEFETRKILETVFDNVWLLKPKNIHEFLATFFQEFKENLKTPKMQNIILTIRDDPKKIYISFLLLILTDLFESLNSKFPEDKSMTLNHERQVVIIALLSVVAITEQDHPNYRISNLTIVNTIEALFKNQMP